MTKQEASDLIDLMLERAGELREAGIRAVNLGGLSFTLAPAEPPADDLDGNQDPGEHPDALHDPWTYGVPAPGGPTVLPKRRRTV